MKKHLVRAGMACILAAAAMAVPLASSAAATPADGSYCSSMSSSGACTAQWTADVNGEFGGLTDGSWTVQRQVCTITNGVPTCTWQTIASGGPSYFSDSPGALTAGSTYQLVITGTGGGSIGSLSGTNTI